MTSYCARTVLGVLIFCFLIFSVESFHHFESKWTHLVVFCLLTNPVSFCILQMPESPPSTPVAEKKEPAKKAPTNMRATTPGKRDPTSARVIEGLKLLYHEKVRMDEEEEGGFVKR